MEEQLISFEMAKLAKAKGFDIRMLNIYPMEDFFGDYKTGELSFMLEESFDEDFAWEKGYFAYAPTQSLLQKWLREEKDIFVLVEYHKIGFIHTILSEKGPSVVKTKLFNTYEEALEAGLKKALELILKRTER